MNTIRSTIDRFAAQTPEATYLIAPESSQSMTYADLQRLSQQIAARLDGMGLAKGDKVAFLMHNGFWTAALMLGIAYAGRVVVPLNAVAGDDALEYVIDHSDCKAIFVSDDKRESHARLFESLSGTVRVVRADPEREPQWPAAASKGGLPAVEEDDTAILIYTSGTTGRPKGVLISHGNAIAGGRNTALAHELTPQDIGLCVLPLYHINAQMVSVMATLVSGACVVLPARFKTSVFWRLVAQYKCTWFSVVPTMIAYLLEHAEREGFDRAQLGGLASLRFGRSASAPLAPDMHREFERLFGVAIVETMGLTETSAQILSNPMPPAAPKYGSPGRAVGNEARIVDPLTGIECPDGMPGELMIRGPNVTRGYYKNPEATDSALAADGWLRTGDIAFRDEDGFFFITGRIKELIIKGGENIAPREIDEALYEHPAVLEAAGFAVPDRRYGQEVMACVALKPGANCAEQDLLELTGARLGPFKRPKKIYFMDELPKGPSGKIQRLKLAELVAGV
jgi:long-chain acyl-CoA synthetase